ncbi:MAG: hypothetical protein HY288_07445 [Planctomycetia bacterium]|nr:hypothetical protein [Planctomycetia bacterium]
MHALLILLLAFLSVNSRLGENPRDAGGLQVECSVSAEWRLDSSGSCASTTAECLALNKATGIAGEEAVGIVGPKVGIRIPGSNQLRFPDELNFGTNVLKEVKNVAKLSYTQQLRDFAAFAQQNSLRFELYVRSSTGLSAPLLNAQALGKLLILVIPGT